MRRPILLRDHRHDRWLQFTEPVDVVIAREIDDVVPALRAIEARVNGEGRWAAGFISYEAAPAFDSALVATRGGSLPLVWFGIFREPAVMPAPAIAMPPATPEWAPAVRRADYDDRIASIRSHIRDGDTYQVNYTFPLQSRITADPWDVFRSLINAQQPAYPAFIETDDAVVCSASPELFFSLEGRTVTSRPMKGTAPRGRFPEEDASQAQWLRTSEKNRAENVMIVDMIRNDIGRIADVGSVVASDLFQIERYPTVWQMTSTVTGQTDASVADIVAALFPCASITGAPKARTTAIIAALETTPRGLYTGAIGFMAPHRRAQFNVAIRTVVIDRATGGAEYGVGGGITWESDAQNEYAECLTKARILTERRPDFALLETMRCTSGVIIDADAHLERMTASADYFGIPFDAALVRQTLLSTAAHFNSAGRIVRLIVSRDGRPRCESAPLVARSSPVRLTLAASPVDSNDIFLFHKTTHRAVYDAARRASPDADDVLLWNERGEVTESCISNVIVEFRDGLWTPPVGCGLLAGTARAEALASGAVRERVITIEELKHSTAIWLLNSVRGRERAQLV